MSITVGPYQTLRGITSCILAFSLALAIAMLSGSVPSFAGDPSAPPATGLRELQDEELAKAERTADAADLLRAAFEARYSWHPSSQVTPSSAEGQQDAEKVIAAYTDVANSYPNSQVAARSAIRLAGFYQYLGQTEQAIDKVKEVAALCEGTKYAPKANFEVGLLYMQAAHNPKTAIEWFQKLPQPSNNAVTDDTKYDEQEKLYLAAQQQIAKCALTLGWRDVAREHYALLAERYPLYQDAIRKEQDAQSKTALHPKLRLADEIIEQSMAGVQLTAVPSAPAANVTDPLPHDVAGAPATAKEPPVVRSAPGSVARRWTGLSLLAVGIVLCGLGGVYGLRKRPRKGELQ